MSDNPWKNPGPELPPHLAHQMKELRDARSMALHLCRAYYYRTHRDQVLAEFLRLLREAPKRRSLWRPFRPPAVQPRARRKLRRQAMTTFRERNKQAFTETVRRFDEERERILAYALTTEMVCH